MLATRVIPCLLLKEDRLVKTIKFKNPSYVGDPINAIKIYNEKEVDELIVLDISATLEHRGPPFPILAQIANECFMPFTYGGGIKSVEDIKKLFNLGIEKVAINSYAAERPEFITEAASIFGRQSIVVSIDVKRNFLGQYSVHTEGGKKTHMVDPVEFATEMERRGAGEVLLNSIDRDGTWEGYDTVIIKKITNALNIPCIACGGAGKVQDFAEAVKAGASAVAAGSMVVYQGKGLGVLINFPQRDELLKALT